MGRMSESQNIRKATHAGSWYSASGKRLREELQNNLDRVEPIIELDYQPPVQNAKAIIAPHAGYAYSGPAAAWAYAAIPTDRIKRIVLLGPSHHAYFEGIALSPFASYDTPLGQIPLDTQALEDLEATKLFHPIRPGTDEDEHSLEMHLPYIRHIFGDREDLRLIPMIVGQPGRDPKGMSKTLAKYWEDPETFFIISTDFCHWGTRFRHTPYYPDAPLPLLPVPPVEGLPPSSSFSSSSSYPTSSPPSSNLTLQKQLSRINSDTPIWRSIQYMDHEGIDILRKPAEQSTAENWHRYLERTGNTICGRNPIFVLINLLTHVYADTDSENRPIFSFVRYEQSEKVVDPRGSSVSYVSGILRVPQ
ncbi:MEMO1 family [Kockovaella imperatae]|uniref:MEMO1 family n=1 Tax=Kockovaella imperatae TaxID=4999 RepID=A0A1Y1UKA6_9TREE|nr:MEMO1 family [Kockovaella imperatae]ORX37967.1 MEMO1 family [Kockovaella imperatae]